MKKKIWKRSTLEIISPIATELSRASIKDEIATNLEMDSVTESVTSGNVGLISATVAKCQVVPITAV
jgi:hypothetical protein